MSYPCHYTNLCPHKPDKHAHIHTHTHDTQNSAFKQSIPNTLIANTLILLITKHTVTDSEVPDCQSNEIE